MSGPGDRSWLGVRRRDLPRFVPIAISFSLIHVIALLVYLVATSLFLARCGPRYLPWTFLAGYAIALALSALFSRVRRPFAVLAVFAGGFCLCLMLAGLNGAEGPFASYVAILSLATPFPVLVWMLFWNSLASCLVLREVKVWTPLILACGILAQIGGGLGLGPLGEAIGLDNVYYLCAAALAAAVAILHPVVCARGAPAGRDGSAEVEAAAPDGGTGLDHPLLGSLARLIFCFAVLKYLVVYQLNLAVSGEYATQDAVAGFLGKFDAFSKSAIFLSQTGLATRLLERVPPGRVMAAMPVLLGAASVAVLGGAGFYTVLFASFWFTLFDKGMNRSCVNLLLAPFSPERARQARIRLEGLVYGTGVVLVSVAMIVLPPLLEPGGTFGLIAALSLAYFFWCLGIDSRYISALRDSLRSGRSRERAEALERLRVFSAQKRSETLREMLLSPDPDRRTLGARELGRAPVPELAQLYREALARETEPKVQSVMITSHLRVSRRPEELEHYLKAGDARVRSSALEALASIPGGGFAALFLQSLDDPHPRPRSIAAWALASRTTEPDTMKRALGAVARMLRHSDAAWRSAGCWSLGKVGHVATVPALTRALGDPDLSVRRQAALALEGLWAPAALPQLQAAAGAGCNEAIAPVLRRCLRRLEDRTQTEVLWGLGHLGREERRVLGRHLASLGQDFSAALSGLLRVESPAYRTRLAQALRIARSDAAREAVRQAVARVGESEATVSMEPVLLALLSQDAPLDLWRVLSALRSRRNAGELLQVCDAELSRLARALLEHPPRSSPVRRRVIRLARMIGVAAGDDSVPRALLTALRSGDRRSASLAAELLEKLLPEGGLRRDLIALLEAAASPGDLARLARRLAG